jgi:hypothetical protein
MKDESILRTTVNIEENTLNEIKEKCKEKDISVTSLIKKCVKKYLDNMKKDEFKSHALTYQMDGPVYKKFHIKLKSYEYDVYSDAKKVIRLSFSHIVSISLERFADLFLDGDLGDTYPLTGYSKFYIYQNDCSCFVFLWGFSLDEVQITLPPGLK